MVWQLISLRIVLKFAKLRRKWRRSVDRLLERRSHLSNDFDRAPLQIAALRDKLPAEPLHGPADGDTAVYSTYCGSLQNFTFNRANKRKDYPHYFISNNHHALKMVQSLGWRPIFLDVPVVDNPVESAQQAKVAKALPHLFADLQKYKFQIYIDDKQSVNFGQVDGIKMGLIEKDAAFAVRESPHITDNILWEFTDSLNQARYRTQSHMMAKHIIEMLKRGKNLASNKLYSTDFIARNAQHADTKRLNENWYQDILSVGIDCQLTFDFLAQDNSSILALPPKSRKKYLGKPIDPNTARTS